MSASPGAAEQSTARPTSGGMGRILQDSSLYLLGNVAGRVVAFLSIPFYSRFLTPADYGLIELIELSTQTIAITLGLQAVGAALSRLFYDEGSLDGEHAVVSTSLIATGVFTAAVTVLAIAGSGQLSQLVFHSDQWAPLLRAAFFAMFLSEMAEVVLVYERIRDRARFFVIYSMVCLAGLLGLNILFIGFLDYGVWGFVCSKLVVTSLGCIVLLTRVSREVGWRWRSLYVPRLVKFGAPLILSSLSYFAIHFSDRFFLSAAVSLADLGRYALAYRFAILVSALVGDSFLKSWEVTLYRYITQPDWQVQFARVASYLTYALFATGLAIALFSPELLSIMVPADFFPPPLLLPILIASYLTREIGDFFRSLLLINKRSGLVGRIAIGCAVLNLAVNAVLIPSFGIYGAALATFATWSAYMVVCWAVAHAEHRLPVPVPAYVRFAVLLVLVYAASELTRGGPFVVQGLLDGFWVLVFCVAAFFVFFGSEERRGATGLVGNLVVWALLLPRRAAALPDGAEPHVLLLGTDGTGLDGTGLDEAGVAVERVPDGTAGGRSGLVVRVCRGVLGWADRLRLFRDRLGWLPDAYAAGALRVRQSSLLYSAQLPVAGHLVALALKHRFGLFWVAELRAPGPGTRPGQAMEGAVERAVMENADLVLVPDAAGFASLRDRYPASTKLRSAVPGLAALVAEARAGAATAS